MSPEIEIQTIRDDIYNWLAAMSNADQQQQEEEEEAAAAADATQELDLFQATADPCNLFHTDAASDLLEQFFPN